MPHQKSSTLDTIPSGPTNDNPIGIFDSGIGGLTMAYAISQVLPNESMIYFGDTAHLPYGEKSAAAIQAYSVKICDVLLRQDVKAILIACNSASSAAFELVREYVGSKALVMNVIDPVVEFVAQQYANKSVGLIGTKQTVSSNVYLKKLDETNAHVKLNSLATPLLATMIEEGFYNNQISQSIVDNYLGQEELNDVAALILGCTHYPLIVTEIQDFYKRAGLEVDIIDSTAIVANAFATLLSENNLACSSVTQQPKHHFYVSDYTESFVRSTELFFRQSVQLEHYRLWE